MSEILAMLGDAALDALLDSLKLLPFLFLTYLLLEYIEHKASGKAENFLKKAGKAGPLVGGLLGALPQCGFAAAVSECYAGRIVTIGTLFAVFLSASDEMLVVLFAESVPAVSVLKILGFKVLVGILFGFLIDFIARFFRKNAEGEPIADLCEREHCHCENGIFRSALHHTLHVFLFVLIIGFALDVVIELIGEESVKSLFTAFPAAGALLGAAIGLIPNCAASVVLTELCLDNVITVGSMLAGLLSGAGVGLLVLFRANRAHLRENILILVLLFVIGAGLGTLLDLSGLSAFLAV